MRRTVALLALLLPAGFVLADGTRTDNAKAHAQNAAANAKAHGQATKARHDAKAGAHKDAKGTPTLTPAKAPAAKS